MITQAAQVTILVKNIEEAKHYYTELLGFTVCDEIEFSPEWNYLTVSPSTSNETRIKLVKADSPEQEKMIGKQAADQSLIMFLSDAIEKDYLDMKERGVIFHGQPKSVLGGRGVGFEDLYGNTFDLYQPDPKRVDTVSRTISASPETIYKAFMKPTTLMSWLPPDGMSGHAETYDPQVGGTFKLILSYDESDQSIIGKTSEKTDVSNGKFLELVLNKRIVQEMSFDSPDISFYGKMKQTWLLETVPKGTKVTIRCENVPDGILKEDHDAGLRSTLQNLADYTEEQCE